MSGAPAAGAANGPPNRKTPSDCTSGDAKTVLTTARLVRSSFRSASGPVDSPHPAAVSTSAIQAISLIEARSTFLYYPRQPGPRHSLVADRLRGPELDRPGLDPRQLLRPRPRVHARQGITQGGLGRPQLPLQLRREQRGHVVALPRRA